MNQEKAIFSFIALPLALKVFRRDQEEFEVSKVANVYLDKLDAVIDQLQKDINRIKHELITVHHIDVRYLGKPNGKPTYICKKKDDLDYSSIEFTSEELKNMTDKVMRDYLYGDKASDFEDKDRGWN